MADLRHTERLDEIESAIWSELSAAPHDLLHGWRVGVLATVAGDMADARSVVLREVHARERRLLVYADSRSPKVEQIIANPKGTLVLWSPALNWQLRLRLVLTVETSGLNVSSRWARLKLTPAAQDYLSPLPPGTAMQRPSPERGSREFFGMLSGQITALDWTELHAQGHRRAHFDGNGSRWLAP